MRMTSKSPALKSDEVAIAINLELPDALFTRPQLQAQITIPKEAVSKPVIDAAITDNIEQAVKAATGFDLKITVVAPE
jgi:hypothetical protein